MLLQLSLVHCLEVAWQRLGLHGVHNWFNHLHLLWRLLLESEVFVRPSIGGREVELLRSVAAQPIANHDCYNNAQLLTSEISHLQRHVLAVFSVL